MRKLVSILYSGIFDLCFEIVMVDVIDVDELVVVVVCIFLLVCLLVVVLEYIVLFVDVNLLLVWFVEYLIDLWCVIFIVCYDG